MSNSKSRIDAFKASRKAVQMELHKMHQTISADRLACWFITTTFLKSVLFLQMLSFDFKMLSLAEGSRYAHGRGTQGTRDPGKPRCFCRHREAVRRAGSEKLSGAGEDKTAEGPDETARCEEPERNATLRDPRRAVL